MSGRIRVVMVASLALIMVMVAALIMTPAPAHSQQGETPDTVFASNDGNLSIQIPSNWQGQDVSNEIDTGGLFPTFMFVGDSADAVETRFQLYNDEITADQVVGLGGQITVVDGPIFEQVIGLELTPANLIDVVLQANEGTDIQLLEGPTEIPDLNGVAILGQENNLMSIAVAMDVNGTVVIAQFSADASVFEANFGLFSTMIASVSVPAEDSGVSAQPTSMLGGLGGGATPTPSAGLGDDDPAPTGGAGDLVEVRNEADTLGFFLPEGWSFTEDPNPGNAVAGATTLIYIGETQAVVDSFAGTGGPASGLGGILIVAPETTEGRTIQELWDTSLSQTDISPTNIEEGEINGLRAQWGEVDLGNGGGYWVVVAFPDNQAMIFYILSNESDWQDRLEEMQGIFMSTQYNPDGLPAELTPPAGMGGMEMNYFYSNDGTLGFQVPSDWLTFDDPNTEFSLRMVAASNQDVLDTFPDPNDGEPGMGAIAILLRIDLEGMSIDDVFNQTLAEATFTIEDPVTETINGNEVRWGRYQIDNTYAGIWCVFALEDGAMILNIRTQQGDLWESEQFDLAETILRSVLYDAGGLG